MEDLNTLAGSYLKKNIDALAEKIFDFYIEKTSKQDIALNPSEKSMLRHGISSHLKALSDSLFYAEQNIYDNSIEWARSYLARIDVPVENIISVLEASRAIFGKELPPEIRLNTLNYIDNGIAVMQRTLSETPSYLVKGNVLYDESVKYLENILKKDKKSAINMLFRLINDENTIRDIYMYIFQPVIKEVGRFWQKGEITTAQMHYSNAVIQLAMSQLYEYIFKKEKNGKYFVAACVEGELHDMGLRMVSDLLELDGWTSCHLGANTSIATIMDTLANNSVNVIGLSVTLSVNLDESRKVIENVRALYDYNDLKIIVGGYVFNNSEELWKRLGADSYAKNAFEAIDKINGLTA